MDARSAANKMLGSMRSLSFRIWSHLANWDVNVRKFFCAWLPEPTREMAQRKSCHYFSNNLTPGSLSQFMKFYQWFKTLPWFMTYCSWNQGTPYSFLFQGWQYQADLLWNLFCNLKISKKWQFLSSFSNCLQFRRHVNLYKWELRWQSHILPA